ncbi:MAG: hypothetical protein IKA17_11255 [Clostridia bacterium]|nr:hypothetical protein [Clostridia bacterium]
MKRISLKHVLLNLIPIFVYIVYAALKPLFGSSYTSSPFALVVVLGLITLTPIYMVVLNYCLLSRSMLAFLKFYLYILFLFALFILTTYTIGGIITNVDLLNPSSMTKGLTKLGFMYGFSILTFSWVIACIVRWRVNKDV